MKITLAVNDDKGLDARLVAAIELARHFGGLLEFQHVHRLAAGSHALTARGMARLGDKEEEAGKRQRLNVEVQLRPARIVWR